MNLKEQILSSLEQLSDKEKAHISEFLTIVFNEDQSRCVRIEPRNVKFAKCYKNSGAFISVSPSKIESAKNWLVEQGFVVRTNICSYNNSFLGYNIYLLEDYAL